MAMIDYGCLMFKNGRLISNGMFTPMKDTCGFVDMDFAHQYFGICGDEDFIVGFYKCMLTYKYKGKTEMIYPGYIPHDTDAWLSYKWSKLKIDVSYELPTLVITKRNGFYVCKFKYKGNKYKIFFGLGVDYDWYKKSHLVNYFRTNPTYLWHSFRRIYWANVRYIKDVIQNWWEYR